MAGSARIPWFRNGRTRSVCSGSRVEVFPAAGHALVMDAEDEVVDRVLGFPPAGPAGGRAPDRPASPASRS